MAVTLSVTEAPGSKMPVAGLREGPAVMTGAATTSGAVAASTTMRMPSVLKRLTSQRKLPPSGKSSRSSAAPDSLPVRSAGPTLMLPT